jgi:mercuric ion transport protein
MNGEDQAKPMAVPSPADAREPEQGTQRLLVAGGIIGALAASSCCILPLVLTVFGISGAWMANLRALAPYQPYFIAMAIVVIGFGFYQVYWRTRQACAEGSVCARPLPNRMVKSGLWIGTVFVLSALSFPIWFPTILPYLP